jgi:PHP family Zn ribbon phosphoesterase
MKKVLVYAGFSIVLLVGLISLFGCGAESREVRYEKAKIEAELKISEFEEMADQIRPMDEEDFSENPDAIKKLAELGKQIYEINVAVLKVKELMPPGYEEDYAQWSQEMRQKIEATYK